MSPGEKEAPNIVSSPQRSIKAGLRPSVRSFNLFFSSLLHSRKPRLLLHVFFSQLLPSSNSNSLSPRPNARTRTLVARALQDESATPADDGAPPESSSVSSFSFSSVSIPSPQRSSILDSLARTVCISQDNPDKAFSLLKNSGVVPSRRTLRSLVAVLCSRGSVERAVEVLETVLSCEKGRSLVDNYICSLVVSGFSRIGKPENGPDFYYRLRNACAFEPNLVTCTSVVDALCRAGRVHEARNFVLMMERDGLIPDAVIYSCLICGNFKEGAFAEGLLKHKLMVDNGIYPDVFNYTNLIDGFCKEVGVEKVFGFLIEMEKNGVKPNLVTYTAAIRGFCKRNKLEEAICVFRRVKELGLIGDEFMYAILIDGLCRNGDLDMAFTLLAEMEKREIKVGPVTYNTIVNGLCKLGKVHKANELSKCFVSDNFTYSTLIHGYLREMDVEGLSQLKRRLDEAGFSIDLVTCNLLLKSFFMAGLVDDAFKMFKEMCDIGLAANSVTYCTVIHGYCKLGYVEKALETFNKYRKLPTFSTSSVHNCMIKELCKKDMTNIATNVFEDIIAKNLVLDSITCRALISALYKESNEEGILKLIQRVEKSGSELLSFICNAAANFLCARGSFAAALDIYMQLRRRNLVSSSKSYYLLLKGLIQNGDKQVTKIIISDCIKAYGTFESKIVNALFLYLSKKRVEETIYFLRTLCNRSISLSVLTAVTDFLKKEGRAIDAYKILMEAEKKSTSVDIVIYSIVVDGLCKTGYLDKALDLCLSIKRKGINPSITMYNSVIAGLCQQGCLTEAFRIYNYLEHHSEIPNVATYSLLIGALSREGFLHDAAELFRKMAIKGIVPNVFIYNKLIDGYCSMGLIEEGMMLLSDMEKVALAPDSFTISSVISGYCQIGDIEGALGFFSEYKERGHFPDFLGFINLIKGLFAKGRMEEARSILRHMLQCAEVVNLIHNVGYEVHGKPLVSLLRLACEQGRLKEVILILNEVSYLFFSSWKLNKANKLRKPEDLQDKGAPGAEIEMMDSSGVIYPSVAEVPSNISDQEETVSLIAEASFSTKCKVTKRKEDGELGNGDHMMGEISVHDFDKYYSMLETLCSKGDMQKADHVVRTMLRNPRKVFHELCATL